MANSGAASAAGSDEVIPGNATELSGEDIELELEEDKEGEEKEAAPKKTDDARPVEGVAGKDDDEETDPEKIRLQRRLERKQRKERQLEARNRDQTELKFLRQRNEDVEKRLMKIEAKTTTTEVNGGLAKALADIEAAEAIVAKATEDGNGKDLVLALRLRDDAVTAARYYQHQQNEAKRSDANNEDGRNGDADTNGVEAAKPGLSETAIGHIKKFMAAHPWYAIQGNDEDSRLVRELDRTVKAEGFDPDHEDYWEELSERIAERNLGRKGGGSQQQENGDSQAGGQQNNRQQQSGGGGPQIGSGRNQRPGKVVFHVSADRKQAMMDAGVWDDPVLRNKQIKQYQKWDAENKAG